MKRLARELDDKLKSLEAEKAKAEADKAKAEAEKALHGHLLQGLEVLTVERQLLDLLPGSAFFRVGTH